LPGILALIAIIILFFSSVIFLFKEFENSLAGLMAEATVSTYLETFYRDGVRCLDNIDFKNKRGDIDHVVISPTGVWTVETKSLRVKLENRKILERHQNLLLNKFKSRAQRHADVVKDFLSRQGYKNVPVRPILVFAGKFASVKLGYRPIGSVYVIGRQGLRDVIVDGSERILSESRIEDLVNLLSKYQSED
jgi:hypothetical protein